MKKINSIWVRRLSFLILIGIITFIFYDLKLKYTINDYKFEQLQEQLQENFHKKRSDFDELTASCNNISTLNQLEFRKDGNIQLYVYDSLCNEYPNFIDISYWNIKDIVFEKNNAIKLVLKDSTIIMDDWAISFDGKINNNLLPKILAYNKITLKHLNIIIKGLQKIDCDAINITKEEITIRYRGNSFYNLSYVFNRENSKYISSYNSLADNYYWYLYDSGLFCGTMFW